MSGTAERARVSAEEWIARAAAIEPKTEAFVDGRFVPAAEIGRASCRERV